ncbi:GNAT family N-acetyltransferase [Pseudodonghicola flavimaris]|uniref:GNAT family N-acetyltransferase n=1 Tax=Pseudodonghicola flavimaris TaxID=3050036 RepID=A0ABT7F5E8_9RHOB|nr:GNAT family N-acetyltransferase [Pseudodonghicola flavimaris]MDK3019832.1 GNAT family N-acetyltransferase [Pseudodonghicola flavimaris]
MPQPLPADPAAFSIRRDRPDSPAGQRLIARHLAEMQAHTPPDSVHVLDARALAAGDISFFLLWQGGTPLAMGALKRTGPQEGELKSMHVIAEARGRGTGGALLRHLIDCARAQGMRRLNLETDSGPDFAAARSLYRRHGFSDCGPFGCYGPDPHSTFMTRSL